MYFYQAPERKGVFSNTFQTDIQTIFSANVLGKYSYLPKMRDIYRNAGIKTVKFTRAPNIKQPGEMKRFCDHKIGVSPNFTPRVNLQRLRR